MADRSVIDEFHFLLVTCEGQRHRRHPAGHPRAGRPVASKVAQFWYDEDDNNHFEPDQWRAQPARSLAQARAVKGKRMLDPAVHGTRAWLDSLAPRADKPDPMQMLEDNDVKGTAVLKEQGGRYRWDMSCPFPPCGLTVPVRDEKLQPLFTKLDQAGWRTVTLDLLQALLEPRAADASVEELRRLRDTLSSG